jgi:RNA polymerase sigma-70 factor (ECF subfamily)
MAQILTEPILKDLILSLHTSVIRVVQAIVTQHDVAEDIAMITWQLIWERKEYFETKDKVKAFLYIAAKNLAYTYLKGERIRRSLESKNLKQPDQVNEFGDYFDRKDIFNRSVVAITKRYNSKYAYIFIETIKGKSNTEIAKELEVNGSTITSVRSIIMKFLKHEIRDTFTGNAEA